MTQGAYYLAMLFRYKRQAEQLNLRELGMELVKEERTLAALPGLIAARLMKVTTPRRRSRRRHREREEDAPAAAAAAAAAKPTDGLDPLRERLKAHVASRTSCVKGGTPVPPDIKTLLLYKPEGLTPLEVFQLDQFLMRGGRIIVLLDTYSTSTTTACRRSTRACSRRSSRVRPIETGTQGLARLLRHQRAARRRDGPLQPQARGSSPSRAGRPTRRWRTCRAC